MKLYVGNLSYKTTEETLKTLFSNYADVASVSIAKDRFTQQSKGFGFVEIEDEIKAQRAIGGMNGKDVDGRRIRVSEAVEKARTERRDFDDDYRSRPRDYDRSYGRHGYDGRGSDYRDSRDSERRYSDDSRSGYGRRDESRNYRSDDYRSRDESYGRRNYRNSDSYGSSRRESDFRNSERRYGRSGSERRNGESYGRFSRRDDNPDEY